MSTQYQSDEKQDQSSISKDESLDICLEVGFSKHISTEKLQKLILVYIKRLQDIYGIIKKVEVSKRKRIYNISLRDDYILRDLVILDN